MGFDRIDDGKDAASAADRPARDVPGSGRGEEIQERDGRAAAKAGPEGGAGDGAPGSAAEAAAGGLAPGDRISARLRARATAGAVYADWDRQESTSRGHPDGAPAAGRDPPDRAPDTFPAAEEALRRVSELEAGQAASDQRLAGYAARLAKQDKTIAEQDRVIAEQGSINAGQGRHLARLEADLGRVAGALAELAERQDEPRASADIEGRFRGKQTERPEWKEEQPKRRLPTDAVNNAASAALGGAMTALPYQIHDLPPEAAGLAAGGVALGAGIIAVWRERRKEKDDADHRPEN